MVRKYNNGSGRSKGENYKKTNRYWEKYTLEGKRFIGKIYMTDDDEN